jgi:hypothetical protein
MKILVDMIFWLVVTVFLVGMLIWSVYPTTSWEGDRQYYEGKLKCP